MTKSYRLALSAGLGWRIVAGDGATDWVDRFARILHLAENLTDDGPELLVVRGPEPEVSGARVVRAGRYVRFIQRPGSPDIVCAIGEEEDHLKEYYKMWDLLLPVYEGASRQGGLPFHAALIEKDGAGVVLSALGGTGKSTCARRVPPPWRALCDDECLVVRDGDQGYLVHPFPTWSDYLLKRSAPVWDVGKAVRLAGVFFLKKAGRTEAAPLGPGEAALRVYDACKQVCQHGRLARPKAEEREVNARMLDNAAAIVRRVPAYMLDVSLTGNFWDEIEQVLAG